MLRTIWNELKATDFDDFLYPKGLLIFNVLLGAGEAIFFWANFGKGIDLIEVGLIALSIFVVFLFWLYARRPKINNSKSIGIVFAIRSDDRKVRKRVRGDLIEGIESFLKSCTPLEEAKVIVEPEHISAKIVSAKDAEKFLTQIAKGHLIVFGKAVEREFLDGEPAYVITTGVYVRHAEIPKKVSEEVGKEFGTFYPMRVAFRTKEEIYGFEVTKNNMALCLGYILGTAALLSRDWLMSYDLFTKLSTLLEEVKEENNATYYQLNRISRKRLAQSAINLSVGHYLEYIRNRSVKSLKKMGKLIEEVNGLGGTNKHSVLLESIFYFLNGRDIANAKKVLKKRIKNRSADHLFSEAFLLAYEEKFTLANNAYTKAFRGTPTSVKDVIFFFEMILGEEPKKWMLWYFLGLIKLKYQVNPDEGLQHLAMLSTNTEVPIGLRQNSQKKLDKLKKII
ncbi:hypothetical protein K8R04_02955 [Candidatus Uhrbacteria bacterium]|nr:hypothetical protein [Candidatus Uhrbacteria bacterium]